MKRYDLVTPEGTKDLLFEDCNIRQNITKEFYSIFKEKGYSEVVTPGLEFYDVFNLNSKYFPQENLYKLVDAKGRLLVVRPDSTMPIARIAATRLREKPVPLRLCYNQSVYSVNQSMTGRSDEVVQMGIELIGHGQIRADFEALFIAIEVLEVCDKDNFRFEIGDIGVFNELVKQLDVDSHVSENIRHLIEMKNYPALNDLLDHIGNNAVTAALKQLPRLFGGVEVFDKATELIASDDNSRINEILSNLRIVYDNLNKLGHNGKISVDLGIVNRVDYYTGIVMKGYLHGYGEAVLSGGRYDKLLSEFGYDVPATGFAINVDAVVGVVKRNSYNTEQKSPEAIVYGKIGYEVEAMNYIKMLINQGEIAVFAIQNTFEEVKVYAEKCSIKKIVIIDERGATYEQLR